MSRVNACMYMSMNYIYVWCLEKPERVLDPLELEWQLL